MQTREQKLAYMRKWRAAHKEQVHASRVAGNMTTQFSNNREAAIIRDGEKCVDCGMTREEHRAKFGKDITVDHIDGLGINTPVRLKNNALENLKTLCLPCHGRKDVERSKHYKNSYMRRVTMSKLTKAILWTQMAKRPTNRTVIASDRIKAVILELAETHSIDGETINLASFVAEVKNL